MATIKPIIVERFKGVNTDNPQTIGDNELAQADNFAFNEFGDLQTRGGQAQFGTNLSDNVIQISSISSTSGWSASDDAANLAASADRKLGAASLEFDIVVATSGNNQATITNSSLSANLSSVAETGELRLSLKFTGSVANITGVRLRWGSDSSNYYEQTVSEDINGNSFAENWNRLAFDWATATTTGTPNNSAIAYVQIQIQYGASQVDMLNVLINDLAFYSQTNIGKTESVYFSTNNTGEKVLVCIFAGTLFRYDFDMQTFFAVQTGRTQDQQADFLMYDNDLIITDGVNDYAIYDGFSVATYPSLPKARFVEAASDTVFLAGIDADPNRVVYTDTATAPTTFPNFFLVTNDLGRGTDVTGLRTFSRLMIISKRDMIYAYNLASGQLDELTVESGCVSNRGFVYKKNDLLFPAIDGMYSLAERQGVEGLPESNPASESIDRYWDAMENKSTICSANLRRLKNIYVSVDTNGDGRNDAVYVLSYKQEATGWTRYLGVTAQHFTVYLDDNNVERLLYADSFQGRLVELETGTRDFDNPINYTLKTKQYDNGLPHQRKIYSRTSFMGFINRIGEAEHSAVIDGREIGNFKQILGEDFVTEEGEVEIEPLGVNPIGVNPLVASGIDDNIYPFVKHKSFYRAGVYCQGVIQSDAEDVLLVVSKFALTVEAQPIDAVPTKYF